jgi:nucleoside-diphosphate kinase
MERTYAMIKPDAVQAGNAGKILARIEAEGFRIVGMKKIRVSLEQAQTFYAVHKARPFYGALTGFLASGPVVALVLEKDNAIQAWRDLIGATNPAQAAPNTIRQLYAKSIDENAAHGSDAPETAAQEIAFFFAAADLI